MKKLLATGLVISTILLLFACGKGSGDSSTPIATQRTTSSATTQPATSTHVATTATATSSFTTTPVTTSVTTTAPTTSAATTVTTAKPTTKPTTVTTVPATTDLTELFTDYPHIVYDLARFKSIENLPAYQVFIWCKKDIEPCKSESYWDSDYAVDVFKFYYDAAELDAITLEYLGRTWDYSTILNTSNNDNAMYSFDPETNMVVLTYLIEIHELPGEDARLWVEYRNYTVIDSTHFEIEYFYQMRYGPEYIKTEIRKIQVALVNGNYIITAHYLDKQL